MKAIGRFETSPSQDRMWFLDGLLSQRPVHNVPELYEVEGPLDEAAFERAVRALVARHEPLRTTFVMEGASLTQVVWDEMPTEVVWRDLEGGADGEGLLDSVIASEVGHGFDLEKGPLLRVTCIRRSAESHVILVNVHHILVDLRSTEIIQRDLGELYSAEVLERPAELPELTVQYADFAAWQKGWIRGGESRRQAEIHQRVLAGHQPSDLPTVHRRPVSPSYRTQILDAELRPDVVVALRAIARESRATLYMVMLAAFNVVQRVYTGSDSQTVGGLAPGRSLPDVADVIGPFTNTVALHTDLAGDPTFVELVNRVRDTALKAFDAQDLPFEEVVRLLVPQRRGARNPFFDVLFHLYQGEDSKAADELGSGLDMAGLTVRQLPRRGRMSFLDLEVSLEERRDTVRVEVTFQEELFDSSYIEQFLSYYLSVLEQVGREPCTRLSALHTMGYEADRTLDRWSRGPEAPHTDCSLADMIQERVRELPGDVAVVFEGQKLTYRELDERADSVLRLLRREGVRRGDVVGLCCDRGFETVIGMWAVLKSGAALLALDPGYPLARLSSSVGSVGAKIVLGTGEGPWKGADQSLDALWVDMASPIRVAGDVSVEASNPAPEDTAYLVFTSGSTGTPKAVAVPHRTLRNLVSWHVEKVTGRGARVMAFAPVGFDVSLQEVFGSLLGGGRLIMCSEQERGEPGLLLDLVQREGVQWIDLPPKVMAALCDMAVAVGARMTDLVGMIAAGERLVVTSAIRQVLTDHPALRLINHYGPAETHVVTAWTLPAPASRWSDDVPIGSPLPNSTVHVLSEDLLSTPPGVPGEICIGGDVVGHGYVGAPRATAEKFVPDPEGKPGSRLYRTGDRGRWLPDGSLAFLGRVDDQVKIRGFRVEYAEVNAAILESELVEDAAVLAVEADGDLQLAAFVKWRQTEEDRAEALRRHLSERLPDYMIPPVFTTVDELPRNTNGKVDAAQLRSARGDEPEVAHAEPRTRMEKEILGLWEELFPVGRVGRNDNFFDIGGHSMMAMKLTARMSVRLEREVSVKDLFMAPTIAELALRLESGEGGWG